MTPGFGGHARGRMEWPFTDVGKTVAGAGFFVWRLSLILNKSEVPINVLEETLSRQLLVQA